MARIARRSAALAVARRPGALLRFLGARDAPVLPRLVLLAALVYLVSPVDLVPDVVPILGWLDDLGIVSLAFFGAMRAAVAWDERRAATRDEPRPPRQAQGSPA